MIPRKHRLRSEIVKNRQTVRVEKSAVDIERINTRLIPSIGVSFGREIIMAGWIRVAHVCLRPLRQEPKPCTGGYTCFVGTYVLRNESKPRATRNARNKSVCGATTARGPDVLRGRKLFRPDGGFRSTCWRTVNTRPGTLFSLRVFAKLLINSFADRFELLFRVRFFFLEL